MNVGVSSGPGQWQHGAVCEEQISVWASTQPPPALPGEDDGIAVIFDTHAFIFREKWSQKYAFFRIQHSTDI